MRIGYIFRYLFIYLLLIDGEKFVISSDQETSLKGSSQFNGSSGTDSSASVAIPSEVGLFTTDGSGNYVKLEQSKVNVVQDGAEYSFELESDVQLTKVEHNSSKVWEHKENKPYPKSVAYKSDEALFAIISDAEIVNCKFENNQWKFQIDILSQSSPKTSVTNVELNLSASAGTNQFEYNKTDDTAEFKAKDGHEFTAVIGTSGTDGVSGKVIWKPMNPNENATRVVLDGVDKNDKKLTIHKKNNEKVEFTKSGSNQNWEEVVTKIELDLSKTSSTDKFNYDKKNELTSFIAKDGYGFNKVLKAKATDFSREEKVWEADTSSNKFAKLVRVKLNDNHIVLILNTGEFILFQKESEDQDWKDITDQRHKLSELKFLTFDQSSKSLKEIDSTYYEVELNGFSYGYTFNDDFELQQIKHKDKLVYNYHSDEEFGLLKGLYLGLSSNKFFITNYDNESKELDVSKEVVIKKEVQPAKPAKPAEAKPAEAKPAEPKPEEPKPEEPEPENTIEPVSVTIPTLSPIELKINKSSADTGFDYDDIGVYKTFTCKQGYGFNKIVNPKTLGADEVIWQSSGNDYATKVRLRIDTNTNEKQILLFLASMKYVFLNFHGKVKQFQNVTSDRHKFYNLKVYTLDNGAEKTLKPDQYTISLYHMSIGCTIKNEYLCSKITYEDKVVYRRDDYQALGQIKGVYLDLVRNSMYVIGINDETKVLEAMKSANPVTLDIRKNEVTDEFDFIQDYQKNVRIFTARGNAVFTKVIRGSRIGSDELIWQSKDIKVYGIKVVTDGLSDFKRAKNVTIHLSNGDVKHLKYSDGKWVQVSNKISLDITKTESSIEFDFYTKDEFTTFTAKDVYLFNKVIESKTIGTETVIWETTNPSEYSTKVTLMITGTEKYMGLLRTDNDVILLHKPPNSDTWDNITSKVSKISDLKMSYYDPSGSYFMLKPEKYKVAFNNLLYGYEFNSGVNCHLVKFGDKLLWSHSDDPKFNNIKGVYVYLRNNNFFVISPSNEKKEISLRSLSSGKEQEEDEEDGDKETKTKEDEQEDKTKQDDKQKEDQDQGQGQDQGESSESSTPATLVELDITKTETTNEYDYEEKNDDHIFTAKTGFKFSKVKKGSHELKDLSSTHAIKITANYNQAGKILLYVYSTNTNFEFSLVNDPEPSSSQASVPSQSGTLLASKVASDQFKLLAEDDSGTSQEFDKQKLTSDQQLESHLINYKFPQNAKCSEVTYKNTTVWKHDKSIHGKFYLTNVFLNTNTSFLMVESQGRYQYYYTLLNDEWKCISGYRSHTLNPLYLDSLKIFTLNQFGLPSSDDETQFTKNVDGNVTTIKFNPGSKCVSVKYGGDELWSHNNEDHEDHYPDTIVVNTNQEFLTLESSNVYRYVFSHYDGKFTCIFAYKSSLSQPIEKGKLKLSKFGDLGLIQPTEATDYEVKESDTTYKFNSGAKCTCIKYNNTEVWKHNDSSHGDKFPTSVSFNNLNRNYLVVESTRSYRNIFQFENSEFKSLGANQKLNHDHNSTGVFDPAKLKFMTTDPSDSSQLVEIALSQYTLQHPTLITFKIKESVKCAEVRYDDLLVWKYVMKEHEGEFPSAVVLNRAKNYIFVESSYYYRYVYSYYNRRWKELPFGFKANPLSDKFKVFTNDPTDPTKLVELDSSNFEREYSSNVVTINFKSDVKCTCIKYVDADVWKYNYDEHKDKFPTSLVLNKKKKFFIVESGYEYRYVYSLQNNIWKLLPYGYKLSESTKMRPADPTKIKLFTMDNNKKFVQLNESKYHKEESNDLFLVKFNPDANCKSIKYDNEYVWSYDPEQHKDRHPTTLVLIKKKYYITVESGYDYRYSYLFYNKKWNLLPVSYNHIRSFDPIDPQKLKIFHLNQNNLVEEITSFGTSEQGESSDKSASTEQAGESSDGASNEQADGTSTEASESSESDNGDRNEQSSSSNGVSSNANNEQASADNSANSEQGESSESDKSANSEQGESSESDNGDRNEQSESDDKSASTSEQGESSESDKSANNEQASADKSATSEQDESDNSANSEQGSGMSSSSEQSSSSNGVSSNANNEQASAGMSGTSSTEQSETSEKSGGSTEQSESSEKSGGSTEQNESSDKSGGSDDSVSIYNIPEGIKCVLVKYDNIDVWRYSDIEHQDKYPNRVLLYKNGTLIVESSSNYEYVYTYENKIWKLVPFGARLKVIESIYNLEKLKLSSVDLSNKPYALENIKHYTLQQSGKLARYTMNQGVKCTEVVYDNKLVWKYHDDEHGDNFPTNVTMNLNTGFITVESKGLYESYFSYYDNKWNLLYGYKASMRIKFKESAKIKFYITNEDGLSEPTHGFHEEVTGPVITYNIFYGVKCTHVKYDEVSVWTYDSEKHGDHYPTSVVFNVGKMMITVQSSDQYVQFLSLINEEWKPFSGYRSQASGPSEVKFYKEGRSGNQVLVHHSKYNVNWDGDNNEYVYDLEKANCNEIRHDSNPVFKLDPNERYPKTVLCSSDLKKIVVRLKESYHVCTMDKNGWKTMIHKNDGSSSKAGPEYPFVTISTPTVPSSETTPETQPTESTSTSPATTTSKEFDLSQALDFSGTQPSTTPESQPTSPSTESTTQPPTESASTQESKDFDLSQALDTSGTATPETQSTSTSESQPSSSSTSTTSLDSDPKSETFME